MMRNVIHAAPVFCMVVFTVLAAQAIADGTVLVSDGDGNKVVRFRRPTGSPLQHFVGSGVSGLTNAHGMAIGPDRNLYVASYDTHSVLKFDGKIGEPLGDFVEPGEGGLFRPDRITFGPDGNLYVTMWSNPRVLRFDGEGQYMDAFVGEGPVSPTAATGLAFSPVNGDLYVGSYHDAKVLRYNGHTGEFVEEAFATDDGLWIPAGMVFDDAGTLYVASFRNDKVMYLPEGGKPGVLIPSGQDGLSRPDDLAIDPNSQTLLVISTNVDSDAQVLEYDLEGGFLGLFLDSMAGGLSGEMSDILFLPHIEESDFDRDGDVDLIDFGTFELTFTGPQ